MRKLFILFLILFISVQTNFGQTKAKNKSVPNYPSLTTQANEMAQAFLTEDYETFSNYMYPKLFEFFGDKKKFVEFTKKSMSEMKSNKASIESYNISKTLQILRLNKQIFGVLQTEMAMTISDKKLNSIGNIVGVSNDNGKNWKFIRVTSVDDVKRFFPSVGNKLKVFPEKISE